MTDFLDHWENKSPENKKLVAQELLITGVTEAIWAAMEQSGLKKSELAKQIGVTKGYISQVLSGSRNMTLRTLSDICFALDRHPRFVMEAPKRIEKWTTRRENTVFTTPSKFKYHKTGRIQIQSCKWQEAA